MSSYFNQGNIGQSALAGTAVGLATHSAGWGLLAATATPLVMDTFSGRRREQTSLFGGSVEGGRKKRSRRRSKMIKKGSKVSYKGMRGEVIRVRSRRGRKTFEVSLPSKRRTMVNIPKSELSLL